MPYNVALEPSPDDGSTQPLESQIYRDYYLNRSAISEHPTGSALEERSGTNPLFTADDERSNKVSALEPNEDGLASEDLSSPSLSLPPPLPPKTPVYAGRKRNCRGDFPTPDITTSPPQEKTSLSTFKKDHVAQLTQLFEATQAESSPVSIARQWKSDAIFERPSPAIVKDAPTSQNVSTPLHTKSKSRGLRSLPYCNRNSRSPSDSLCKTKGSISNGGRENAEDQELLEFSALKARIQDHVPVSVEEEESCPQDKQLARGCVLQVPRRRARLNPFKTPGRTSNTAIILSSDRKLPRKHVASGHLESGSVSGDEGISPSPIDEPSDLLRGSEAGARASSILRTSLNKTSRARVALPGASSILPSSLSGLDADRLQWDTDLNGFSIADSQQFFTAQAPPLTEIDQRPGQNRRGKAQNKQDDIQSETNQRTGLRIQESPVMKSSGNNPAVLETSPAGNQLSNVAIVGAVPSPPASYATSMFAFDAHVRSRCSESNDQVDFRGLFDRASQLGATGGALQSVATTEIAQSRSREQLSPPTAVADFTILDDEDMALMDITRLQPQCGPDFRRTILAQDSTTSSQTARDAGLLMKAELSPRKSLRFSNAVHSVLHSFDAGSPASHDHIRLHDYDATTTRPAALTNSRLRSKTEGEIDTDKETFAACSISTKLRDNGRHGSFTASKSLSGFSEERQCLDRVWACFKGYTRAPTFYPASCVNARSPAKREYTIQFDDGHEDVVESHLISLLDLRVGDQVKVDVNGLRNGLYVVTGFKDPLPIPAAKHEPHKGCDCRGYRTVSLYPRVGRRSGKHEIIHDASRDIIDVPISSLYVTTTMWSNFEQRGEVAFTPVEEQLAPGTSAAPTSERLPRIYRQPTAETPPSDFFSGMAFAVSFSSSGDALRQQTMTVVKKHGGHILMNGFEELFDIDEAPRSSAAVSEDPKPTLSIRHPSGRDGFLALLSDTHLRTAKYMQALALNIPCISYRWAVDCLDQGRILSWRRYLLPAGESVVLENAVRSRNIEGELSNDTRALCLASFISHRPMLLEGLDVAIVLGRGKTAEDQQAMIFIAYALGAKHVERAVDMEALRGLEQPPSGKWDLVCTPNRLLTIKGSQDSIVMDRETLVQSLILGELLK